VLYDVYLTRLLYQSLDYSIDFLLLNAYRCQKFVTEPYIQNPYIPAIFGISLIEKLQRHVLGLDGTPCRGMTISIAVSLVCE